MPRAARWKDLPLLLIIGATILAWAAPAVAQNVDCAIITRIEGNEVTLSPEDGKDSSIVIEFKDVLGLKVGDRVKVQNGQIVMCVIPLPNPEPGKKSPAVPGAKPY